jgi:FtsP/CotA-like multicopper oxidase with cupredoxin domain
VTDLLERLRGALADRYSIEHQLGAGGMATVYLAEDLTRHRKVAVKVLRPELPAALGPERLHREIEIAFYNPKRLLMNVFRFPRVATAVVTGVLAAGPAAAQTTSPLLPAGSTSGLPLVQANDNRVAAGTVRDGVQHIALEVKRADWRLEQPGGPGLRVAAVAEAGGPPMIPAPLVRVETGTRVRVQVRNLLDTTSIAVFGLHTRPGDGAPFDVAPGEVGIVEFDAGAVGTYLYWIREGPEPDPEAEGDQGENEQLAGAFIVDPVGGSPADEILVINIFSERVDETVSSSGSVEGLAINGRSWPFTERMMLTVGEELRWRVVNASNREHPMHLHGFFYQVLSRGTVTVDTVYGPADRRTVVTESMTPRTTMSMTWTPTRPGRWLFHCHLSFHVAARVRLPGARESDPEHAHSHLAGLVIGMEVAPGPTDLVSRGEPVQVDLFANAYGDTAGYRYGFAFDPNFAADSLSDVPGPVLVFNQFQTAHATVHNRLPVSTGVHWHGLELDGWADGVPGWSASDGRVSPELAPGDSFTYRLSFLRPGTFIYHSHLDDIRQLSGGLYGALLVLPEGETYDPDTDHIVAWGWNNPEANRIEHVDWNGRREQPDGAARVGETHRFRVFNIAPAGRIRAWFTRDGEIVPITLLAKDGADLPVHQRVPVERIAPLSVGETVDFTWTPSVPGTYELHVGYRPVPRAHLVQRWVVESR